MSELTKLKTQERRMFARWQEAHALKHEALDELAAAKKEAAAAKKVLRRILKAMRWDNQHGYVGYRGDGKWDFVSTGLPQTTPEELNALFSFAGIVPDAIVPKGQCEDCKFSEDGQERGYRPPCVSCTRPYHSNFVPLKVGGRATK